MKHIIFTHLFVAILFISFISCCIYGQINYNDKINKINITTDSIILTHKHTANLLYNKIDSLTIIQDSLNSEIFVLKYKLSRIKEYNRIAESGNNIKFLRGWINRVLNE